MKVNHVLILAAGKGTRMGEIGKRVPKVLWPIGNMSLIDLEIEYAKTLTDSADIFINIYNYKEKLLSHFANAHKANLLIEEETLDIGGAIHNLAKKVGYKGNLLIINSDQFIFMTPTRFQGMLKKLENCSGILFGHEVRKEDKYNALALRENKYLDAIIPNENVSEAKFLTYTGMSIINLEHLAKDSGCSKFFDSVVKYKDQDFIVENVSDLEYWDFGTLKQFHENVYKLRESKKSAFYQFLTYQMSGFEKKLDSEPIEFKDFFISKKSIKYQDIQVNC